MNLHIGSRVKKLDARSIKVAFTTEDIARLIGWTPDKVLRLIRTGELVFTGDCLKDFQTISSLRNKTISELK